jgi:arsenate reductase (glutaredoxin)
MTIQVYGIPNCGTCKKALKWLEDHNITYEFINTKEHKPPKEIITNWVKDMGNKPLRNTSGKSYRELGEDKKDWTDQQWINAFSQDAMLLKRPIFVKNNKAVLTGFRAKEEKLLEILT